MDSQIVSDVNENVIEELRQCASLLSEKLQSDSYEEASVLINSLTENRDKHIFQSVGKLTRALHDAIVNFNVDGATKCSVEDAKNDECELNDASSRLEYVIDLTQNAADKTMDMVEACAPISSGLGQEAISLKQEWAKLRNREMTPDEFRSLYNRLDGFFEELDVGTTQLNDNLQNIILEQGFQDLTGQVLKRVISLISEVEADLVSLMRMAGQVEQVVGIEVEPDTDREKGVGPDIAGEGPQVKASQREDVVESQDDVDDLLSSLGFEEYVMSFSDDDEILQDFLVEAGEILELLSEELVELEQSPEDKDLLNSIFRGFHTVKGGAGFLQLDNMVECCHVTENLFDILRNGQREVTPELMDVVLQALDTVNEQFADVQQRNPPQNADPELIASLARLVACEDIVEGGAASSTEVEGASEPTGQPGDEITDGEFEQLVDAVSSEKLETAAAPTESAAPDNNDISDDEFEALLDELHGQGKAPKKVVATKSSESAAEKPAVGVSGEGNKISDDEFENLLDQLHGKGKGPTHTDGTTDKVSAATPPPPPAAPAPKAKQPEPKPQPKKSERAKPAAAREAAPPTETTVRVDTQRLDDIMNMVGELVLVRNRLVRLGDKSTDESLGKAVSNLDVVTADLQTSVMKTRMQPIKKVFGRFPRVVRDLARNLKKEINLELVGEETDLDKNLVEALADPLVHLVRNSVDHGIEGPDVREANGKPRIGKIILAAQQEGDHILLSITDDGGGMDANKLRGIAVDKGLMDDDAAQRLSDVEAFNLIFAPGFSTKTEISDVSGRGVGMDVVKTKINQLNGSIEINSGMGEGTRITIKVPLTLAIMPTLMIMLGEQAFALPLVSVNEIFHMDLSKTNIVDGQECITIRDRAVPVFYLKRWLVGSAANEDGSTSAHVVIVSVGTQRVGFVVDQLIGQEEVVIKPLGKMLHGTPGMAGATITGDGTIALILDVPSMLKRYVGAVR